MKIKTNEFTKSPQAKKLPEEIEINTQLAYVLGLWNADRSSTAKGIVGVRSKDNILLEIFRKFLLKLGLTPKERIVTGYGKTKEVYACSMPLRRIFEWLIENRVELFSNNPELILAYLAGVIDGDGSFIRDKKKLILRIFYGKREIEEATKDKLLLRHLSINPTITIPANKSRKVIILTVRNENFFFKVKNFIQLERKLSKISGLARPTVVSFRATG